VKRGTRTIGLDKELIEKLGGSDPCPCGSGRRFPQLLPRERPLRRGAGRLLRPRVKTSSRGTQRGEDPQGTARSHRGGRDTLHHRPGRPYIRSPYSLGKKGSVPVRPASSINNADFGGGVGAHFDSLSGAYLRDGFTGAHPSLTCDTQRSA
jgi:hypothetical protein